MGGQDVAFGPANGRDAAVAPDGEIVERALARVGLDGHEDRLCSRLSNGERSRGGGSTDHRYPRNSLPPS